MTANHLIGSQTRRGFLCGTAAVALAGCGGNLIGPPSPAAQIYALNPQFGPLDAPQVGWQLVVAVPVMPGVLDTSRIALERAPNLIDYYANAEWADRLSLVVQSLLVEAFERSGKIAAVGRETAGLRADYVLETEVRNLEAFYARADTAPKVRVAITAKLLGALSHEVAGVFDARHESPAAVNDMSSITAAFSQATGSTVEDIATWALRTGRNGRT